MEEGRLTPFMVFYTEHRDSVKARFGHGPARPEDISKEVFRLWRTLGAERTRDYCLLSNLYTESMMKHAAATRAAGAGNGAGGAGGGSKKRKLVAIVQSTKAKRKKDPRLPKVCVSAFMWFSRHHRTIVRNEHREMSFCEVGKTVGALWKAATAEGKRPFEDLAAEDKARYTRELAEYKTWLVQTETQESSSSEKIAQAPVKGQPRRSQQPQQQPRPDEPSSNPVAVSEECIVFARPQKVPKLEDSAAAAATPARGLVLDATGKAGGARVLDRPGSVVIVSQAPHYSI